MYYGREFRWDWMSFPLDSTVLLHLFVTPMFLKDETQKKLAVHRILMKFSEKKKRILIQPERWSEPTLFLLSDVLIMDISSLDSGVLFISCTEVGKVFLSLSLISIFLSVRETEGF